MLIDCHVHAFRKEYIKKLLSSMKKNGIDKSVILYFHSDEKGHEPFSNVIENIKNSRNLFLAGSIEITNERGFPGQFSEIKSAMEKKQIVGVKLHPGYGHFFANDERCSDVYELCAKHGLPVIFHTGDTFGAKNALVRYANPIYIDDVAVKFPKLKMVIAHMGYPCWVREAAEVIRKNKNVYADFSGTLSLTKKFEKTHNESVKKDILWLAAYCGTGKILFGTDYDLYDQGQYVKFLESFTDFSKADMECIRHRNAERVFGI